MSIDGISDSSPAWKVLELPDLDHAFKVLMVRSAQRDDLVINFWSFADLSLTMF